MELTAKNPRKFTEKCGKYIFSERRAAGVEGHHYRLPQGPGVVPQVLGVHYIVSSVYGFLGRVIYQFKTLSNRNHRYFSLVDIH